MNVHASQGEKVEITARLCHHLIEEIDQYLEISRKKPLMKQRRQFIEEILEDWYQQSRSCLGRQKVH